MMETFTKIKPLADNPHFERQRKITLDNLDIQTIDVPIIDVVQGFTQLPYCFPMQSCYGHFFHKSQKDPKNIEPLPLMGETSRVVYRIAYLAICIQNRAQGRALLQELQDIPLMDPEYIQFGCAEWFWERQVNSYALQVEPARFMTKDRAVISYKEALHIQKLKGNVFGKLNTIVIKHLKNGSAVKKEEGQYADLRIPM
jgi:hypothetical protein